MTDKKKWEGAIIIAALVGTGAVGAAGGAWGWLLAFAFLVWIQW